MTLIEELINYCEEQVKNHSIYVSGGQGQGSCRKIAITDSWIRKMEKDDNNYKRAVAFWQKQIKAGYGDKLSAFDCSGLVCCFFQNMKKILKYDHTAHGLYGKCEVTNIRKPGYLVFRITNGRAVHVGVIVNNDYVIHSKGRDVGVVKEKYRSSYWHKIGRPKFVPVQEYEATQTATSQTNATPGVNVEDGAYVFTRNLKRGRKGEDVIELKKLLIKAGYSEGITVDTNSSRNYGRSTKKLVKQFQIDHGLEVDGIAGSHTIAALGGMYQK